MVIYSSSTHSYSSFINAFLTDAELLPGGVFIFRFNYYLTIKYFDNYVESTAVAAAVGIIVYEDDTSHLKKIKYFDR
ncbi:hypothetical protein PGB90_003840 [Kerria lacca]